ncbi:MAG: hypothetical protein NXY57DRAFT_983101 [Lentinula lateritia]|nr:MAG: hypothetical protein NXY57DRAFT_983101 [Lentinula lateritia]
MQFFFIVIGLIIHGHRVQMNYCLLHIIGLYASLRSSRTRDRLVYVTGRLQALRLLAVDRNIKPKCTVFPDATIADCSHIPSAPPRPY